MIISSFEMPQEIEGRGEFGFHTHLQTKNKASLRYPRQEDFNFAQGLHKEMLGTMLNALTHLPCEGTVSISIRNGTVVAEGGLNFWTKQTLAVGEKHLTEMHASCLQFGKQHPTSTIMLDATISCELEDD